MVLTDEKRALLGDHEAAKRLTDAGVLVPCPCCGGNARVIYTGNGSGPLGYISNVYMRSKPGFVMCDKCGLQTSRNMRACRAVSKWNTRAQILSAEEVEILYGKENP